MFIPEAVFQWGEVEDGKSFACGLNRIHNEIRKIHPAKQENLLGESYHICSKHTQKDQHLKVWQWRPRWQCQLFFYRNPAPSQKARDYTIHLEIHMKLWTEGKKTFWLQNIQPRKHTTLVKLKSPLEEPHPILFEKLNGALIRETILKMDGGAGPSGFDAASWKCVCTSFKGASADLCDSLAATARRICTCYVDPSVLTAFTVCPLIALYKCPWVRLIGIGETACRIIGRAIARVLRDDIQAVAGSLQLCAGHQSGCEAAIHAWEMFESSETEAISF